MAFFKKKWVIQLIGVLALSILVWFVGPYSVLLESLLARGLTVAALWIGWIILVLLAEVRASRKERRFVDELAGQPVEPTDESVAIGENIGLLNENFDRALQLLRETQGSHDGKRQHLYDLPWYVIIGPPGSGKTTALLNAGLKFPMADRLGKQPIPGTSGTRNCEWMFTDEAILIDTAGRYVTQESYKAVDAAEWNGFLDLLKRHRPRRPINGILVTMSLRDLLEQTEEERTLHTKAIRQRIQELYAKLGVRFPIYMLFTKCDLIAGFDDFFADLREDGRAQVWGETFPIEGSDPIARFDPAFDELLQRLGRHVPRRMEDERDIQRRGLIFSFPQQMAMLKPLVMGFLDGVFATSRYETCPLLRGVYLTSGTQEGSPIDRVMGALAASFRFNRQVLPVYSGQGKSYFVRSLLKDVVFAEAGLAGVDPKEERRRHWLQTGAFAAVGLAVLAGLGVWALSYQRNGAALDQIDAEMERFRAAKLDTGQLYSYFRSLLPKLDALLAAHEVYDNYGLAAHFGLYQGEKLERATRTAYERWLKSALLPLIREDLAERITGPAANNPGILFELLRIYLMLGNPDRMEPQAAASWIKNGWEGTFAMEPTTLARLSLHLDHLLALKLDPLPLDKNLLERARDDLTRRDLSYQIYDRFKNEALLDKTHDLDLGKIMGPQAERVFVTTEGRPVNSLTIPGLYTAWGYSELFLAKGKALIEESTANNWVISEKGGADTANHAKLHRDLHKLYLADYQQAWRERLAEIDLRHPRDIDQTIQWLDVLSSAKDNPVRNLLQAVEKNTTLTRLAPPVPQGLDKLATTAQVDERLRKLMDTAKQLDGAGGDDPALALENNFREFNELTQGTPPTIDTNLKTLAALRDQFLQFGQAQGQGTQNGAGSLPMGLPLVKQATLEFGHLPEPLKGWFLELTGSGSTQIQNIQAGQKAAAAAKEAAAATAAAAEKRQELTAMLKAGIAKPCRAALEGRYPFSPGSANDVTLQDFAKVLGPGGALDQFFQTNLMPLVDVNRPAWAEKASPIPLGLSPVALRQFQIAEQIRAAYFGRGGTAPSVSFQLKPLSLDANVGTFRLNLEGQEIVYRHDPPQTSQLQWPGPNLGGGVRMVFETLDGKQVSQSTEGPWAWFRLLDRAEVKKTESSERFIVTFQSQGYSAEYELRAASVSNPFNLPELRRFSCPDNL